MPCRMAVSVSAPQCRRAFLEPEEPVSRVPGLELVQDAPSLAKPAFAVVHEEQGKARLGLRLAQIGCRLFVQAEAFRFASIETGEVRHDPQGPR